ncbi:hypothetical protein QBC44DRAFT_83657 [Cladorrhinum sp. PSN332]|nr:hypothetical protein QBC44DRAFT_83657 [Cladorrhinum sp. PSN332]
MGENMGVFFTGVFHLSGLVRFGDLGVALESCVFVCLFVLLLMRLLYLFIPISGLLKASSYLFFSLPLSPPFFLYIRLSVPTKVCVFSVFFSYWFYFINPDSWVSSGQWRGENEEGKGSRIENRIYPGVVEERESWR